MATVMPSSRLGTRIAYLASRIYFVLILLQIPLFRVPCRSGMCTSPLEVTSCQLVSSGAFPLVVVKALLYPGALIHNILHKSTIPSWEGLLEQYNLTSSQSASQSIDLRHLEVLAGSYFAVAGAFIGLLKPGRMSMFGTLLIVWGLVKETVLGKPMSNDPAKAAYVYPTILIALLCAVFSVKYDTNKVNRLVRPVAKPLKSSTKAKLK
eukprot:TRINITY_DN4448_c0_g1_i1.p1 TRINITY_DN4448_c0_g1~~TRINITY_DN4448_c0_g1_i1.p1  ORF type:complete len:208 (+),score=31.49 TRINITY_DN4448_c0_g1_i1:273-896(+)